MTDIDLTSALIDEEKVKGPVVLHEGRYRVYEKPDGGIHVVYKRDDKDTEDHMEIPGKMLQIAKMASEGKLSLMDMVRETMKLRNEG